MALPNAIALSCNPVDLVEVIARRRAWSYSRESAGLVVAQMPGLWDETTICVAWHDRQALLRLAAVCRLPMPDGGRPALLEMLAYANGLLDVGHFCIEWEPPSLCFRHTVALRGASASIEQLEDVLLAAIEGLDQFYPAFQHAVWGGKSPAMAVAAAMIHPAGEA